MVLVSCGNIYLILFTEIKQDVATNKIVLDAIIKDTQNKFHNLEVHNSGTCSYFQILYIYTFNQRYVMLLHFTIFYLRNKTRDCIGLVSHIPFNL